MYYLATEFSWHCPNSSQMLPTSVLLQNAIDQFNYKNLKTREARKINCICSRGCLVQKDQRSGSKEVWLKSEQIMWLQGPAAARWMLWTRQRAIFAIFNNRTFKVPQRFDPVQQQMHSDSLYAWLHHGKDRGETNNHFGKYFIWSNCLVRRVLEWCHSGYWANLAWFVLLICIVDFGTLSL